MMPEGRDKGTEDGLSRAREFAETGKEGSEEDMEADGQMEAERNRNR